MQGRYEIKFVVPVAARVPIVHDVAALLRRDKNAQARGSGYRVRSLYLETAQRDAYQEKLAGIEHRYKFRVREYDGDESSRFVEIKERCGNQIRKRKEVIGDLRYRALIAGRFPQGIACSPVLQELWQLTQGLRFRPLLITEYLRLPFVGRSDLRVTIDTDIKTSSARSLEEKGTAYSVLAPGHAILEVKFTSRMPHWVHHLIQKYSLQNVSYSKYCPLLR